MADYRIERTYDDPERLAVEEAERVRATTPNEENAMARTPRKVYFLEPIIRHADGSITEPQVGFWEVVHDHIGTLSTNRRFLTSYGIRYGGSARSEQSPAVDYIYLGRRRPPGDFPDHAPADNAEETSLDIPGALVEPMYIRWVPRTNYAAFLRTSGGPTFSACERWLSHVLGYDDTGDSIALRPYVRDDAFQRLAESDGVAKLELKYDPDALRAGQDASTIENALAAIDDIGGGGVSIELGVSFGRARPSEIGAERYARELRRALDVPGLAKAQATILRAHSKPSRTPGVEATTKFTREHVNFLRDQVVHSVKLSADDAVRRTPSLVLDAMGDAVQEFLRGLN